MRTERLNHIVWRGARPPHSPIYLLRVIATEPFSAYGLPMVKVATVLTLAGAMFLVTLTGCMRAAPTGACSQRARPQPSPIDATARSAHERLQQQRLRIPETPVDLIGDYAMPPHSARQSFLWGPHDIEWRATFIHHACEFIGFHLRRPLAVPEQRRGMHLFFELWPADLADSLALGLRDRPGEETPIAVVPIARYQCAPWRQENRAAFVIPLEAFDRAMAALASVNSETNAARGLDWNAITGIHLMRLNPAPDTHRQLIISQLQLVPPNWVRQLESIRSTTTHDEPDTATDIGDHHAAPTP